MEHLNLGLTLPPENVLPYTGTKDKMIILIAVAALVLCAGLGMVVQKVRVKN